MARTSRRTVDGTVFDLLDDLSRRIERFTRSTFESLARAQGPVDDIPPLFPLSTGFTDKNDVVLFDSVKPGSFTTPYYHALNGNDLVYLPSTKAKAAALGYDPTQVFYGDGGNDYIVGQGLNDLINGGRHNDYVAGGAGADLLFGDFGNDTVLGGTGNDILGGGFGEDLVDGGDGNDVIYSTEEDGPMDDISGGAGDDDIAALDGDNVDGEDGNDLIWLLGLTDELGFVTGGNGDDTIVGSIHDDFISTGLEFLPIELTPATKAAIGGHHDKVDSGDGDDYVATMTWCTAEVTTGNGKDTVRVEGLWDVVSSGAGDDEVTLAGGAGLLDLGDGDDLFVMSNPAADDNPNISQVTLGWGFDRVHLGNNEWFLDGAGDQSLNGSPLILDFDPDIDIIEAIFVTNVEDSSLSLNPNLVTTIAIPGGSALVYDAGGAANDFCFARFAGVSAADLQNNIDQNATYI
jgi:Ca2+-binding RTX toxin-like protein